MFKAIRARIQQGHRTIGYPKEPPVMPELFRGYPRLSPEFCPPDCNRCAELCPVEAISRMDGELSLEMGRCLFCPECAEACPHGGVAFTTDPRLAVRRREELLVTAGTEQRLATALGNDLLRLFGRSSNCGK